MAERARDRRAIPATQRRHRSDRPSCPSDEVRRQRADTRSSASPSPRRPAGTARTRRVGLPSASISTRVPGRTSGGRRLVASCRGPIAQQRTRLPIRRDRPTPPRERRSNYNPPTPGGTDWPDLPGRRRSQPPRSKRVRLGLGTTAFVLGLAWAGLSQKATLNRADRRRLASASPRLRSPEPGIGPAESMKQDQRDLSGRGPQIRHERGAQTSRRARANVVHMRRQSSTDYVAGLVRAAARTNVSQTRT